MTTGLPFVSKVAFLRGQRGNRIGRKESVRGRKGLENIVIIMAGGI